MNDKNVIDIEGRIPSLKEQRRHRANRRLIIYLSCFFLLVTIVAYFQSSFSQVKTVEVTGNDYVSSQWIVNTSNLLPEVSMWGIDEEEIKDTLLTHPIISEVSVSRVWFNTVVITIEEFKQIGYIEVENSYYPLLETGHVINEMDGSSTTPYDGPILLGFHDEELRKNFAEELVQVSSSLRQRMSEIHLSPTDSNVQRLLIYMNDGFVVSSTVRKFSERIAPYPAVVSQLDPSVEGIVHMRMNPYFESFEMEEEEEGESEG